MPTSRARAAAETKKLKDLAAAVQHRANGTETDPFDRALVAGVVGLAERLQAESADLEALRSRMVRLARQTAR